MFPPSVWSLAGQLFEAAPPGAGHHHPRTPTTTTTPDLEVDMTIRRAQPTDAQRLADLAALDSTRALRGDDVLVAEVDGAPIAAYDVFTGRSIADPLSPSAGAVELLRVRAEQLRAAERPAPRRRHHPLAAVAGLLR